MEDLILMFFCEYLLALASITHQARVSYIEGINLAWKQYLEELWEVIRVGREMFMFAKPQTVLYIDSELISEFSLIYNYIQIALNSCQI